METADIIIIGGGAAGLMAAHELAGKKQKVILLEARDRLGGRIHTINDANFAEPVEAGAEFIHGNLPVTFRLIKEAGLAYAKTNGIMWRSENGKLKRNEDVVEGWELLQERIAGVHEDLPLAEFLNHEFSGPEHQELVKQVTQLVQGYDAADVNKVSSLAMKQEWSNEDQWEQYRIEGGYISLVNFLEKSANKRKSKTVTSSVVKQIKWEKDDVRVICENNEEYLGRRLIITVPLGLLQAEAGEKGAIVFDPAIPERIEAARKIGFGAVIKVLLKFSEPFWQDESLTGQNLKELGYLFSDTFIPTWWTQYPSPSTVLTGWLAGPQAQELSNAEENVILMEAMQSLAKIFSLDLATIRNKLIHTRVINWTGDPFSRGAYAYATVETAAAKEILKSPLENTIFFAGEGLYSTYESGTVEMALASGEQVAKQVLASISWK